MKPYIMEIMKIFPILRDWKSIHPIHLDGMYLNLKKGAISL